MRFRLFSFGVALTSGASLALSLLFTRIFSVTMYYHFAFFLVSLALLGIAVAGVVIFLLPRVFTPERLPLLAGAFAVLVGPLVMFGLYVAVNNPMSVDLRAENVQRLVRLYAATGLPFLASGFAISLAIAAARERVGTVYAFDLVGAALGCMLTIPLIGATGGQGAVLVAGGVAALGGVLLALSSTSYVNASRAVAVVGVLVFAVLGYDAVGPAREHTAFRIVQGTKFLREQNVEWERWNALSRVTVSKSGEADHKWIHIDADAATRILSGEQVKARPDLVMRFPESRVSGLVYAIRKEGPALIIGPGGGPDVHAALMAGVPRVVGVEVNPLIAETVMKGAYRDYNGGLYDDPRVDVHVDDGRSFVRRSEEQFSSIQATLVDTWAASAAGAFTLTENNLYTAEAFVEYLRRLKPQGVLSMTRWYGSPPLEFIRLLGLGREALTRLGVSWQQHGQHFFVVADNRMATMLLKRTPFTPEEIEALTQAAQQFHLRIPFSPATMAGADPQLTRFFAAEPSAYYAASPHELSPTTDNRPFFFYTVRTSDFLRLLGNLGGLNHNNLALAILQILLLMSVALTLLLVVLPLALFRRDVLVGQRSRKLGVLGYFLAIGFGYILVELGLMQKFILFLGHPIYALAVVLATLLASSGVGSALSARLVARFGLRGTVVRVVAALSALLIVYLLALGPLFSALLGLPVGVRIALGAVLIALPGLMMGTLMPVGVRTALGYHADLVPWGWGLNGATSVVGSVLAVVLSINFGFAVTLLAGVVAYALGALALSRSANASQMTVEEAPVASVVAPEAKQVA
ncbi:MAG: hypothetical protein IRZ16_13905 [Myxococcaceae bacterium]|nr:hypothetical protein [Myxococcaceae bacterium]